MACCDMAVLVSDWRLAATESSVTLGLIKI